ncbi:unnamed protein product, partial [Rotaria sp. Silwood1]
MTLELIPNSDLVFKGPFNVVSTATLKLYNSGNDRLAYKIKTTAPKRYCVKPKSGFLDAHASANMHAMLQPEAADKPDDRTTHKFMVQWVAVDTTLKGPLNTRSLFGMSSSVIISVLINEDRQNI